MEGLCKKHWSHNQAKGVCPFCLRERLQQLASSSSSAASSSSSSSTPSHESNSFSAEDQPSVRKQRRAKKSGAALLLQLLKGKKTAEPLRRSRSLAFPKALFHSNTVKKWIS